MRFIDRTDELARLTRAAESERGGLLVLYGRRRVGKTRLLLEWARRVGGLYTVADQSAAEVQRRYLAGGVATLFPGFADVDYRDWSVLLDRVAREAVTRGWRGPLIINELPYLVATSPELPSVVQRWLDHEARPLGGLGPWDPPSRWWHGAQPEWDVVSRSVADGKLLAGEAKWSRKPFSAADLDAAAVRLAARSLPPPLEEAVRRGAGAVRALFVPACASTASGKERSRQGVITVTAEDLLR